MEVSMKKGFSLCLLGIFLLGLVISSGHSQTANEILEKMIEAQGGRKALEKIKDTTVSGSVEMIQFNMSASITIYMKEPNMMRADIEVMGMMITQAYDGKTAWAINPQTGSTEKMPEQQAEYTKRQALGNDALLHPEKYGITYTYKGKEKIEDKDYLVLEQTFSDGFKATHYVNPDTYLAYKTKAPELNQMGIEVESETFMSNYKKVDGLMVAHSITTYQDGEEYTKMTITEVKFNSGLEDSLFKMSE